MEFVSAMGGASTIVLAFLHKPYSEDLLPSCIESVAVAAMENLCLAAYEQGLGSCWVEVVCRAGRRLA